jgi:hypothetical protein
VGRPIVEHDADQLGLGGVQVDEVAHAFREVAGGAAVGDLDGAPGPVDVEEDEQISGAVAAILAFVALELAWRSRIGWRTSPLSWVGLSSKHTTGRLASGVSA